MTPQAALIELLARVGTQNGGSVLVSAEDLSRWPADAVAALHSQKLLAKARPAATAVCPGCEQQCVMPVHPATGPRGAVGFVVCDKRDDINRVPVARERVTQWRCDAQVVCSFVATSLGLKRSDARQASADLLPIGIALGNKRRQALCLRTNGVLELVAGTGGLPLGELISFDDGAYWLDVATIRQLVDSATIAGPRYTPSNARREARKLDTQAMYIEWQRAYRGLKKRRPSMSDVWYSQQIAKQDIARGRDADTIRKHIK